MLSHTEFIGTKHPIVCLAMNGVSDVNLAIAVSKAGALPSLSLPNYMRDMGKTFLKVDLVKDISRFYDKTGSGNIMISLTDHQLFEHYNFLIALCKQFKITHIEIIVMSMGDSHYTKNSDSDYLSKLTKLNSLGVKIIAKSISFPNDTLGRFKQTESIMDGILIKGLEGAGKVNNLAHTTPVSLLALSALAVSKYPDKAVIPSGGICTAAEIKNFLSLGCTAVGIGTLFALSEESKVAESSKLQIIADNKRKLDQLECEGVSQNAFVFQKYEGDDNSNHSVSLKLGTQGKGGHLFVGKGISEVNEILPVAEIVNRLTQFDV
jgi:NAD(P)H-dependent flavin oxidoreductase YrpB (nitropropane dioxygenase family)